MEQKVAKINSDKLFQIVSDMNNINFNNQNPLISDLLNHVEIESSINREIPQVQSKIDLITSQQFDNPTNINNISNNYSNVTNGSYSNVTGNSSYSNVTNSSYNNVINDSYNNVPVNEEEYYEEYDEESDESNTIGIAKLCIISVIIIAVLCFIVYRYVNKYKYIIMCCIGATVLASDYFIGKRLLYF